MLGSNGRIGGSSFESMDREDSRKAVNRVLQSSNSVDIPEVDS
jgi:hypothetical protein